MAVRSGGRCPLVAGGGYGVALSGGEPSTEAGLRRTHRNAGSALTTEIFSVSASRQEAGERIAWGSR